MNESANLVRNPDFQQGRESPAHWRWERLNGQAEWRSDAGDGNGSAPGLTLRLPVDEAAGQWVQTFRCRGEMLYRVEVRGTFVADRAGPGDGLSVRLRALRAGETLSGSETICTAWRSRTPRWWRTYYRTPRGATQLELAVRAAGRRSVARILSVRAVPMDFLLVEGHPLACPPPPQAYPRPAACEKVAIVRDGLHDEAWRGLLGAMLGPRRVRIVSPRQAAAQPRAGEALVIPSKAALPAGATWRGLCRSAERRMIVLSLDAFAALVNRAHRQTVALHEWRQVDDTIAAKVHDADFITNGLALEDTFHFHELDGASGGFVQRQMARTVRLRRFIADEGMRITLVSETNTDSTSGRPLALYKRVGEGGIFVIDPAPLLAEPTSEAECSAPVTLLCNLLGLDVAGFGQYADPRLSAEAWQKHFGAAGNQLAGVHVDWIGADGRTHPYATAGAAPVIEVGPRDAFLDRSRLPVVAIRAGVDATGRFGIAGAWTWLKNLVRMEPHACRYAPHLLSLCRPIIIPHASSFPGDALERLVPPGSDSLVIDLVPSMRNAIQLRVPAKSEPRSNGTRPSARAPRTNGRSAPLFDSAATPMARATGGARWLERLALLPDLDRQLRLGVGFGRLPAPEADMGDLDAYGWRFDETPLEISPAGTSVTERSAPQPSASGGIVLRLELPVAPEPAAATSIVETHRLATLLELIIGLRFGLLAVNRSGRPRRLTLDRVPPMRSVELIGANGRAETVDADGFHRRMHNGLDLDPGATLWALA